MSIKATNVNFDRAATDAVWAELDALRQVNAELLETLKVLDAYWSADFPEGPDGLNVPWWRSVRAAIARAEGCT